MAKEFTPECPEVKHWDTLGGREELSGIADTIMSRHKPVDRSWVISSKVLKSRRDKLRAEASKKSIDVTILYGTRADFSTVVWATGYKTPLTEVAVAIGNTGEDCFIADPELFRTVQEYSRRRKIGMDVRPIETMGLTDELYTFVPWSNFRDVFRLLSRKGPDEKIKVAVATPDSSISYGFVEELKKVKNIELYLDDGNMIAPLMFEKDEAEIKAAHSAAYVSGISCDVMLGCMRPGIFATKVVGKGYDALHSMGVDDFDWPILFGVREQNQGVINKLAQEFIIQEGDWVNAGVSAHYGGISAVERFCVKVGGELSDFEREVYNHIKEAFLLAKKRLEEVVVEKDLMRYVDSAFREYLSSVDIKSPNTGELVNLGQLIAYSGAHDLGALECGNPHVFGLTGAAQPFSLHHAVDKQLMGLDIAIRGYRESPERPLLGNMHYIMIEKTAIINNGTITIPSVVPIEIDDLIAWCGTSKRPENAYKKLAL